MRNTLEVPPNPPEVVPLLRGGGDRGKPPWRRWLALALLTVGAASFSIVVLRGLRWQPVATCISVGWAIVWLTITNRRIKSSDDRQNLRYFAGSIVGGMVAMLIQTLVTGPTMGVLWLMLGAVGIGGGFGIGAASVVYSWYALVSLARLLLNWRAA